MSLSRVLSLTLILASGISGAVLAQDAEPNGHAGDSRADHGRWDPAAMRQHIEARRAEHAKALHDILGIQPSQEAAFTAFNTAMTPPEKGHDMNRDDARGGPGRRDDRDVAMTTPERLDRMKARMDRRFAEMRDRFDRRAQAMKTLYAALDSRQRAVMDALPELSGPGRGEERMGRMGGPGPIDSGM